MQRKKRAKFCATEDAARKKGGAQISAGPPRLLANERERVEIFFEKKKKRVAPKGEQKGKKKKGRPDPLPPSLFVYRRRKKKGKSPSNAEDACQEKRGSGFVSPK